MIVALTPQLRGHFSFESSEKLCMVTMVCDILRVGGAYEGDYKYGPLLERLWFPLLGKCMNEVGPMVIQSMDAKVPDLSMTADPNDGSLDLSDEFFERYRANKCVNDPKS